MDRVGTHPRWQTFLGKVIDNWGMNPVTIAKDAEKRRRSQLDRRTKENKQAHALRKKTAGTQSSRHFDQLTEVMKQRSPAAIQRFLGSSVGQSCLRLLNRLDDTVVEGQLRVRGLTDAQIGKLRDQIFAHARNNIASRIDARVKQTAARIGKLIRDPAQRSKLVAGLEKLKTEKERMGELAKLGITGETARRIARNPRKSEAELVRGLKATAANLEALHRECLMAMQDDKRALGLFAMTRKGTAELRKALNVPSNGSFAGNCVERGLAKAKNSKEAETLLKKFTMAVASIASGGVLACVVTSAAPALDKLGEASTKRKVAEAGAALGLTGRGTVEKARRAEKNAKLGVYVAVGTGLATGVGGNATYVKIGKKAFDKLSAKAAKEAAKHADKLAEQAQSLLEKAASVVTGAADRE